MRMGKNGAGGAAGLAPGTNAQTGKPELFYR